MMRFSNTVSLKWLYKNKQTDKQTQTNKQTNKQILNNSKP